MRHPRLSQPCALVADVFVLMDVVDLVRLRMPKLAVRPSAGGTVATRLGIGRRLLGGRCSGRDGRLFFVGRRMVRPEFELHLHLPVDDVLRVVLKKKNEIIFQIKHNFCMIK